MGGFDLSAGAQGVGVKATCIDDSSSLPLERSYSIAMGTLPPTSLKLTSSLCTPNCGSANSSASGRWNCGDKCRGVRLNTHRADHRPARRRQAQCAPVRGSPLSSISTYNRAPDTTWFTRSRPVHSEHGLAQVHWSSATERERRSNSACARSTTRRRPSSLPRVARDPPAPRRRVPKHVTRPLQRVAGARRVSTDRPGSASMPANSRIRLARNRASGPDASTTARARVFHRGSCS